MIIIGVTAGFMYPDPQRIVYGKKTLCYVEKDMANWLMRDGVMPVMIPDLTAQKMHYLLRHVDGILLTGGTDVSPSSYGESCIHPEKWHGDKYRDAYELAIVDWAMKNQKPVLGICRGIQLLNVYFGGTLYQDIQTQLPGALIHRDADLYDQVTHAVELTPGGWLEKILDPGSPRIVNSVHHQAIKTLGRSLTVEAVSPEDGIIEAVIWEGAPPGWVTGIQWHPEFAYHAPVPLLDSEPVYDAFLQCCVRRKSGEMP